MSWRQNPRALGRLCAPKISRKISQEKEKNIFLGYFHLLLLQAMRSGPLTYLEGDWVPRDKLSWQRHRECLVQIGKAKLMLLADLSCGPCRGSSAQLPPELFKQHNITSVGVFVHLHKQGSCKSISPFPNTCPHASHTPLLPTKYCHIFL